MIVKTKGVVIRSIKYGESSVIFDAFTADYGKCSFIVGGVRKKRAKIPASLFQLMSWVELVVYYKNQQHLNRVKEARPLMHYQQIPFDIQKRSIGLFMVEIMQKSIKETEANPALYEFILNSFLLLDREKSFISHYPIYFLLNFSRYLGFYPHGTWSPELPYLNLLKGHFSDVPHPVYTVGSDLSEKISEFLICSYKDLLSIRTSRRERQEIVRLLITFYGLHLEKFQEVNTHKILAEVLG